MAARKLPTASETVVKAQRKVVAAGGVRLTLTLSAEEAAPWRALLERYPGRGGQKQAFLAAVSAQLEKGEPTAERAIDQLQELLDALRRAVA